jgi:hypothetical protein
MIILAISKTTYFFFAGGQSPCYLFPQVARVPLSISRIATIQWRHFVTGKVCNVDRVTAILGDRVFLFLYTVCRLRRNCSLSGQQMLKALSVVYSVWYARGYYS